MVVVHSALRTGPAVVAISQPPSFGYCVLSWLRSTPRAAQLGSDRPAVAYSLLTSY